MTGLFYLALGASIIACLLLYRKLEKEARHEAWLRDHERRVRGAGVDLSCWKWPAQ
jgi:hypothetical protein